MDSRLRNSLIAVAFLVPALFLGALAVAAGGSDGKIADGVTIQGVAVGGLTADDARARLQSQIQAPAQRPVKVRIPDGVFKLSARKAGVRTDIDAAIAQAQSAGEDGGFVSRGWRKLTGGEVDRQINLRIVANRVAVREFVKRMERRLARNPQNAQLQLRVDRVTVKDGRDGRRLAAIEQLKRTINEALVSTTASRELRAKIREVKPKVTKAKVWDVTPVAVTVSKSEAKVRVFKRGEVVQSYGVSVGSAEYPTPEGEFVVQTKQVNPVWSVPNSSWAGTLAGQVIPGGAPNNPLVARWIGIDGSVGFHGSRNVGGAARSHGCIRMVPDQVIELYDRVELGTPVLVAA